MAYVHRLSDKNTETMTAVCASCGPVRMRWKAAGKGRNKTLACAQARVIEHRARADRLPFLTRPHGLDLIEAQDFREGKVCALCGSDNGLVVDHCHESGQIRDVLCAGCNKGLGFFRDDPELLVKAAEYVRHHKTRAARG
jgi:recombination endonuclease VII